MLSEKEQTRIKQEYSEQCPSNIPLWKYVLYNYRLDTRLARKEPYIRIDSVEDILLSDAHEIEQKMKQFRKSTTNIFEEIQGKLSDIESEISKNESGKLVNDIVEKSEEEKQETA